MFDHAILGIDTRVNEVQGEFLKVFFVVMGILEISVMSLISSGRMPASWKMFL